MILKKITFYLKKYEVVYIRVILSDCLYVSIFTKTSKKKPPHLKKEKENKYKKERKKERKKEKAVVEAITLYIRRLTSTSNGILTSRLGL